MRGATKVNDFSTDNTWQLEVRDRILAPWYGGHFGGKYILMDKGRFADLTQRQLGVDTVAQGANGVVAIEEKIVRWKGRHYTAICVETDSCTVPGHESEGWARYSQADFLLYCMMQENGDTLKCHCVGMPELRRWFWPRVDQFKESIQEEHNRSAVRLVPIRDLEAAEDIPYAQWMI